MINRVLSNRILDYVELMRGIVMHNQKENHSVIRKKIGSAPFDDQRT